MQSQWYQEGDVLLEDISHSKNPDTGALLWFLGQSGFAFRIGSELFLIDAVLDGLLNRSGVSQRVFPSPFLPEALKEVDYFLCTHGHIDHMPIPTILPLAAACPKTKFIVPLPEAEKLENAGIPKERIIPASVHAPIQTKSTTISSVAAAHTKYRTDDHGEHFYLSYVIKGEDVSIFHAGDTVVTTDLMEAVKQLAPIDIALLPINGRDWKRTDNHIIGNMNARDAVVFSMETGAELTIPCHYDMFPGNTEDPSVFVQYLYRLCPEKRHKVMALGEKLFYTRR